MGKKFTTGNSTVAGLGVGSILRVSGKGELEILDGGSNDPFFGFDEEPEVESYEVGDSISVEGHGAGTVVKLTSRTARLLNAADGETDDVIYLTDSDYVVRSAPRSKVSFA